MGTKDSDTSSLKIWFNPPSNPSRPRGATGDRENLEWRLEEGNEESHLWSWEQLQDNTAAHQPSPCTFPSDKEGLQNSGDAALRTSGKTWVNLLLVPTQKCYQLMTFSPLFCTADWELCPSSFVIASSSFCPVLLLFLLSQALILTAPTIELPACSSPCRSLFIKESDL